MNRNAPTKFSEIWALSRSGFGLLTAREKGRAVLLSFGVVFVGAIETLAIGSVMPLVGMFVDPEPFVHNKWIIGIKNYSGIEETGDLTVLLFIITMLLLLVSVGTSIGFRYILSMFGVRIHTRLAKNMLATCLDAPYPWFIGQNSAKLVRIFYTDIGYWARGFVIRLLSMFNDVVLVVFIIVLIVLTSPLQSVIILAAVGLVILTLFLLVKPKLVKYSNIKRHAVDELVVVTTQAFQGIKDIKLSNRMDAFVGRFDRVNRRNSSAHAIRGIWGLVPNNLGVFFGQIGLIGVAFSMWSVGVDSGVLSAQIALVVVAFSRVIPAAIRISTGFTGLMDTLPYIAGIISMKDGIQAEAGKLATPSPDPEPSRLDDWKRFEFRHVSYQYANGSAPSLIDVSLTFERGKSYGIVGSSGAGKSTLVDLALCLLEPASGEIAIDGIPLIERGRSAWQRRIGYVPQMPFMADATLRENVAFGVPPDKIDDVRVRECLSTVHLGDLVDSLEDDIYTEIREQGARLSGGQRQRVAIARALYDRPDILVLDEATNALDPISENAIQMALDDLRGAMTLIMIAHRTSTIRNCDSVFLLDAGRLMDHGSFDQLQSSSALFQEMLRATENESRTADFAL